MLDKVSDNKSDVGNGRGIVAASDSVVAEYHEEDIRTVEMDSPPRKGIGYYTGKTILALIQAALMIAILAGSFFIAKRMVDGKPEAKKRPAFKTVYTVNAVTAKQADNQPKFISYGQTVAARTVELRSLVSGEIVKINPNLRGGATVNKGDPLVEISDFEYKGALSEAKSNLAEAKARIIENAAQISLERSKLQAAQEQLKFAETDLARAEKLVKRKALTVQQVEARKLVESQRRQTVALSVDTIKVQEARLGQMKATIDRLDWRVAQAQRNLDSTVLLAPFTGIVQTSTAEIGRAITANDLVVSMYEVDSLEARFTLTDAQYGRLQTSSTGLIGRAVDVAWTVGGVRYSFPARIDRVSAQIEANRGGVEVIAKLESVEQGVKLRPGAFVEVSVPDTVFANTFMVPDTAIYNNDTVYKVVDGKLQSSKVTVAAYQGEQAIIATGVAEGDRILTTRITEVSDGLAVRIEGEKAPARPSTSGSGKSGANGRPSREEIAKIIKANNLTLEEFRGMDIPERRKLIAQWRQQNAAKE
jgi:RND family efflux transporter MFP subunit